MENPIAEGVHPKAGDVVHRIYPAEHMVPLKDLVQKYPVEEASKADAEQYPRKLDGKRLVDEGCVLLGHSYQLR